MRVISFDKGVSGVAALSQLCETVKKAIKKLKPNRVLLSEIPQIKNGDESNNSEIEEFNKQLGKIALDLNGSIKWTKVEDLKWNISTSEICKDGVPLNIAGVQKIVKSIRNYYQQHNITELQTTLHFDKFGVFNQPLDCVT